MTSLYGLESNSVTQDEEKLKGMEKLWNLGMVDVNGVGTVSCFSTLMVPTF